MEGKESPLRYVLFKPFLMAIKSKHMRLKFTGKFNNMLGLVFIHF